MADPPLLRLPPELRNRIAELVLTRQHTIKVGLAWGASSHGLRGVKLIFEEDQRTQSPKPQMRAITQVCSQLRKETKALFYAVNSFSIHTWQSPRSLKDLHTDRENMRRAVGSFREFWVFLEWMEIKVLRSVTIGCLPWWQGCPYFRWNHDAEAGLFGLLRSVVVEAREKFKAELWVKIEVKCDAHLSIACFDTFDIKGTLKTTVMRQATLKPGYRCYNGCCEGVIKGIEEWQASIENGTA